MYNSSSQQKAEFRKTVSLFRIQKTRIILKIQLVLSKEEDTLFQLIADITPFHPKATRPNLPTNRAVFT